MRAETDTALILRVGSQLQCQVAEESGLQGHIEMRGRFRLRDSQIEHIGWALMAEVQRDYPSGRLYIVSMATALAVEMVPNHSSVAGIGSPPESGMPRHRLRQVQSYMEENLRDNLSLQAIAGAVGMSDSHLKVTFRKATGVPAHQYVIRQRVERALTCCEKANCQSARSPWTSALLIRATWLCT